MGAGIKQMAPHMMYLTSITYMHFWVIRLDCPYEQPQPSVYA